MCERASVFSFLLFRFNIVITVIMNIEVEINLFGHLFVSHIDTCVFFNAIQHWTREASTGSIQSARHTTNLRPRCKSSGITPLDSMCITHLRYIFIFFLHRTKLKLCPWHDREVYAFISHTLRSLKVDHIFDPGV